MILGEKVYCDSCHYEIDALNEDEANAEGFCGWTDYRTAEKHFCNDCYDWICDRIGFPPCEECETHPCERENDCWASPPLHIFPYETYFADLRRERD